MEFIELLIKKRFKLKTLLLQYNVGNETMKKYLLCILLLLSFSACQLNEPQLPSWETKWSIELPLYDYTLAEALTDSNTFYPDTTSGGIPTLNIQISDSSDWEKIKKNDLAAKIKDERLKATLGTIQVDKPKEQATDRIFASEILSGKIPGFEQTIGSTIPPFPKFTFHMPPQKAQLEHYEWAEVAEGHFYIVFHNDLFLTIDSGMVVKALDEKFSDREIARFSFGKIKPGESATSSVSSLAGKTISNQIIFRLTLPVAGSDIPQIYTQEKADGSFYLTSSMSNLVINAGSAKVPQQSFLNENSISLEEQTHQLKYALVDKGSIHLTIHNHLPLSSEMELTLPNISRRGAAKTVALKVDANDVSEVEVDLSGWNLINPSNSGEYIDHIIFETLADIDSSSGYVEVYSTDSITVDVEMDSLYFSYFEGTLTAAKISLEEQSFDDFDTFGEVEGKVRFEDMYIKMDFHNEIDFDLEADLKLTSYRRDPSSGFVTDSVVIKIEEHIYQTSLQKITTIIVDKDYSTPSIVDLLEILPTEIKITAKAAIDGEGSAAIEDGVRLFFELVSPLTLQITAPLKYAAEMERLTDDELGEDVREKLAEDLLDVKLSLLVDNGLPLAANVALLLATDSTLLDTAQTAAESERITVGAAIEAAEITEEGFVVSPQKSTVEISLNKQQLQIFNTAPLYLKQFVTIPASPQKIRFSQKDKIKIDGKLSFKTLMNKGG
jgi:hypothetical protein